MQPRLPRDGFAAAASFFDEQKELRSKLKFLLILLLLRYCLD
jgi:hypothetical protein